MKNKANKYIHVRVTDEQYKLLEKLANIYRTKTNAITTALVDLAHKNNIDIK